MSLAIKCPKCGDEENLQTKAGTCVVCGGSLAPATGSASVCFELEGQHTQDPRQWSIIGEHATEAAARKDESEYREWNTTRRHKGWMGFRVVKVTTTREVMPNS